MNGIIIFWTIAGFIIGYAYRDYTARRKDNGDKKIRHKQQTTK